MKRYNSVFWGFFFKLSIEPVSGANKLAQAHRPYVLICILLFMAMAHREEGNKTDDHYSGN